MSAVGRQLSDIGRRKPVAEASRKLAERLYLVSCIMAIQVESRT